MIEILDLGIHENAAMLRQARQAIQTGIIFISEPDEQTVPLTAEGVKLVIETEHAYHLLQVKLQHLKKTKLDV